MRQPEGRAVRLAVMVVVLIACLPPTTIVAQDATPLAASLTAHSEAHLQFPRGIEIVGEIEWEGGPDETWLELIYQVGSNETLFLTSTPMTSLDGEGRADVTAFLELQALYIPPGLEITWYWQLVGVNGVVATALPESTVWYDDRQEWQVLANDVVELHYFGLDEAFAAEMLSSVVDTIGALESRFALSLTEPFALWVYPTATPFLEAVAPNMRETMVAATYPEFSIILAVVPNGNSPEIARVIPHEVTHLVLFQATDNPFTYLPLWFNEGMATHFQTGGTDGYLEMVINALERDRLYSLTSIDVSFPYTAYEATLAYAASWSAVAYILDTWGDDGIARLIDAYATGVSWEAALGQALGVTNEEFDEGWRAWIVDQAAAEAA